MYVGKIIPIYLVGLVYLLVLYICCMLCVEMIVLRDESIMTNKDNVHVFTCVYLYSSHAKRKENKEINKNKHDHKEIKTNQSHKATLIIFDIKASIKSQID